MRKVSVFCFLWIKSDVKLFKNRAPRRGAILITPHEAGGRSAHLRSVGLRPYISHYGSVEDTLQLGVGFQQLRSQSDGVSLFDEHHLAFGVSHDENRQTVRVELEVGDKCFF